MTHGSTQYFVYYWLDQECWGGGGATPPVITIRVQSQLLRILYPSGAGPGTRVSMILVPSHSFKRSRPETKGRMVTSETILLPERQTLGHTIHPHWTSIRPSSSLLLNTLEGSNKRYYSFSLFRFLRLLSSVIIILHNPMCMFWVSLIEFVLLLF